MGMTAQAQSGGSLRLPILIGLLGGSRIVKGVTAL
jgi:hypothetical protein